MLMIMSSDFMQLLIIIAWRRYTAKSSMVDLIPNKPKKKHSITALWPLWPVAYLSTSVLHLIILELSHLKLKYPLFPEEKEDLKHWLNTNNIPSSQIKKKVY